jgi:hypothetical protein
MWKGELPGAWWVIHRAEDGVVASAARPPSRNAEFLEDLSLRIATSLDSLQPYGRVH